VRKWVRDVHGSRWKLIMMTILIMNTRKPYFQKTDVLLNLKGRVTSVEGRVIKVQTVLMMGRISFLKMALVGFVLRKVIGCLIVRSSEMQELNLTELV
jgi:hypothetical protein